MPMVYRQRVPVFIPPEEPEEWSFEMGENVNLIMTGETGFIVGRMERDGDQDQYEITYVNASGELVTKWWPDGALEPVNLDS